EVAHLRTDAVALLEEREGSLGVTMSLPDPEVVQDRSEDERISRLLGELPGLVEELQAFVVAIGAKRAIEVTEGERACGGSVGFPCAVDSLFCERTTIFAKLVGEVSGPVECSGACPARRRRSSLESRCHPVAPVANMPSRVPEEDERMRE